MPSCRLDLLADHVNANYSQVVADVFNAKVYTQVQHIILPQDTQSFHFFRVRQTRLQWVALTEQFIWPRVGHKTALSLRSRWTMGIFALGIEQRVIKKGQETMFYEGHVADGSNAS